MAKTETPAAAMKAITIQGIAFDVSQPYAAGQTITEAEAAALNQTRSENIRNNQARKVKEALAALPEAVEGEPAPELSPETLTELADAVTEYDKGYEFTLASVGGGRASKDPVDVEAVRMAKAAIAAQLKADNRKVADVDKEVYAAAVAKVAASESIVEAAKKAVAERSAAAKSALEGISL